MNIHKDFGSHRSMKALISRLIEAINEKISGDDVTVQFCDVNLDRAIMISNLGKVPASTYSLRITI